MTFKKLMDELSGVSVDNYEELVTFIKELKSKKGPVSNELTLAKGLVDWTVSDENWHEVEIW